MVAMDFVETFDELPMPPLVWLMCVLRVEEYIDQPLDSEGATAGPGEWMEARRVRQVVSVLVGDGGYPVGPGVAGHSLGEDLHGLFKVGGLLVHVEAAEDRDEGPDLLVGDGRF